MLPNSPLAANTRTLPPKPVVLCVSRDATVNSARVKAVASTGFAAAVASTARDATDLLTSRSFAAVIVCSTLTRAEQFAVARLARLDYETPVIVVYDESVDPNIPADSRIPKDDAHRLVSAIRRLLQAAA